MKKSALFVIMSILALFTGSSGDSVRQVRNVVTASNRTWRRGEVVYNFGSVLDNSKIQIIKDAMQEVMNDSSNCVTFLHREGVHSSDDDFVYFTASPDSRCSASSVGKRGGQQVVLLGSDCMTRTGVMPLLLLTLGLYREHQRPDRDEYIDVHYTNIKREHQRFFEKIDPASTDLLGLCYDYNSITHFGPFNYAVDLQKPTITSNFSNVSFGNRRAMSVSDVKKVQELYKCGINTSRIERIHRHFQVDCTFENPVCGLVNSIGTDALWSKSKNNSLVHGDHTRGAEDQLLFDKIDPASTDLKGLQYDYNSITHFGPYAYAVDVHKPTVTANFSFGNKRKLSVSDVEKVQQLYHCELNTSHIKGIPEHFQIDCTFENPVCGLINSINTSALWSKSNNNSLVHGDHSRGAGHFMHSNSNGTLRYIKAGLFCIQLAIFHSDTNTYLDLHAELPDRSVTISNTTQCTDTGRWKEYEISVNASTYWRLIIEAHVGPGSNGIAVDDVSVTEGYCLENWCKSSPITLM